MTLQQRWFCASSSIAVAMLCVSCKGKEQPQSAAPAAAPAIAPSVNGAGAEAGRPRVVGGTAEALRQYLTTVDTVEGATFDVSWRPGTIRLDRETTIRALQGVSPDGSTFELTAAEPAIKAIVPGSVVLIWGVALRKVMSVSTKGDNVLLHTSVASLPDAIDHGHIAWKTPANFARGVVAPLYRKPDTLAVSMGNPSDMFFRLASYEQPALGVVVPSDARAGGDQDPAPQASQDDAGDATPSDEVPVAALDRQKGEAFGMEYEVGYLYSTGGLDFELEASKKDESPPTANGAAKEENKQIIEGLGNQETGKPNAPPPAQGSPPSDPSGNALKQSLQANHAWASAKKQWDRSTQDVPGAVWMALPELTGGSLWRTAKDQLDLRIKAQGHLDGLDLGGDISVGNAKTIASKFQFNNVNGIVNFQYVARLGKEHGNWDERLKAELPVTFNIPLIVGGLPFMFQVGVNLFAVPALSTHLATAQGKFHLNFAGNGVVQAGTGNLDASGQYQGKAFVLDEGNTVSSLGVSAVLVSIQFPRLGFGMGLFNSYSIVYIDFVGTGSALSSGAMGMMPCQRYQVNAAIGAGVSTQVLGLPAAINKKLSWRKTPNLWDYQDIKYRPPGLNCAYKKQN